MTTVLESYVTKFRRLRSDSIRDRWPAATNHRAPHKPLLLLSVMDLIEEGSLSRNLVEIIPDLGELFSIYWSKVMPPDQPGNMAMPFFHLKSDGFWRLVPRPGKQDILAAVSKAVSLNQLKELAIGAQLDEELFALLCHPESRQVLRATLVEAYFAPDLQPALLQQGRTNVAAYEYSNKLLERARTTRLVETAIIENDKPAVRDQGFRRAIVVAYQHRCAVCGLRIMTPDGHTVVDAAHIKPWSVSRNDDPRNGLALCRLCHWTFDEGLLSVSTRFLVAISTQVIENDNLPGHLVMLRDREIFRPVEERLWPDVEMLRWHNSQVFRRR